MRVGLELATGNINGYKQKQITTSFIYYPFGNTDFYGKTYFSFFKQKNTSRYLWSQTLGVKLIKNIWFETGYRQGDFSNTQFERGFLVYNLPEKINFMTNAAVLFFINKHTEINLRYQYFDKSDKWGTFVKQDNDFEYSSFNYQSNNLIIELIWKF